MIDLLLITDSNPFLIQSKLFRLVMNSLVNRKYHNVWWLDRFYSRESVCRQDLPIRLYQVNDVRSRTKLSGLINPWNNHNMVPFAMYDSSVSGLILKLKILEYNAQYKNDRHNCSYWYTRKPFRYSEIIHLQQNHFKSKKRSELS